jgi:hypothetical protein
MSGAAVRCDYPRNVGRRIAPRYLAVSNLCKVVVRPGNTTGRPQGQAFPQTPCKAFRQCEFVIFRASFLRPFPFRLPTEQCPSFPASLARLLSEARGKRCYIDANTTAPASQLERCNFPALAQDLVPSGLNGFQILHKNAQDDASGLPLRSRPLNGVTSLRRQRQPR